MIPIPLISGDFLERGKVQHGHFHFGKVLSAPAHEGSDFAGRWHPHVVKDNVPAHLARQSAEGEFDQRVIETMVTVNEKSHRIEFRHLSGAEQQERIFLRLNGRKDLSIPTARAFWTAIPPQPLFSYGSIAVCVASGLELMAARKYSVLKP